MDRPRRTASLRLLTATAAALTLTGGLFVAATGPASAATPGVAESDADFNGDGLADAAVSAPAAYVNGRGGAGQVVILYGGGRRALISQNTAGVPGAAEAVDNFGFATAYGDFDGDGFDDLAVGTPGEDGTGDPDSGTVAILWGSTRGLTSGTTVSDPRPASHDWFGYALEAGDFDGNGKDDLAIGTPNSTTVDIVRGGARTTTLGGAYTVRFPGISGKNVLNNLHSGDVNGDGKDDLLTNGYENTSDSYNANYYLPGTASGVKAAGAVALPAGIITDVGDVDSDGKGDIVFGLEWDNGIPRAQLGGAVLIAHGTASGPDLSGIQTIDQDTAGVPGAGEKGDDFGGELDLGDIDGDGHLDLVVGARGEDLAGVTNAGAIIVLYGAKDGSGITGEGAKFYSQDTPGVPNSNEKDDKFGTDVHIDDLDDDGRGDVLVGANGENNHNGAVYSLHSNTDDTLSASAGIYTSTVGISATGASQFGVNFAD